MAGCHQECEIFTGRLPEGAESEQNWTECEKNPGHEKFICVPDFVDNYLPRIKDLTHQDMLRACVDRTVRLRVRYTSLDRPDDDDFSEGRGTDKLRVGTGFIWRVSGPVYNELTCVRCGGGVLRKHWRFSVRTARHVVYNTEEAKNTTVDLYYDDADSQRDGRMKSVRGLEVLRAETDKDYCLMKCVTCDEDLMEKIDHSFHYSDDSLRRMKENLLDLGLAQSCHKDCKLVLIISHPHAQPKKITVGELKYKGGDDLRLYTTPTCPGSSGAPVFLFDWENYRLLWLRTVHNGSYGDTNILSGRFDNPGLFKRWFSKLRERKIPSQQLNYGHWL